MVAIGAKLLIALISICQSSYGHHHAICCPFADPKCQKKMDCLGSMADCVLGAVPIVGPVYGIASGFTALATDKSIGQWLVGLSNGVSRQTFDRAQSNLNDLVRVRGTAAVAAAANAAGVFSTHNAKGVGDYLAQYSRGSTLALEAASITKKVKSGTLTRSDVAQSFGNILDSEKQGLAKLMSRSGRMVGRTAANVLKWIPFGCLLGIASDCKDVDSNRRRRSSEAAGFTYKDSLPAMSAIVANGGEKMLDTLMRQNEPFFEALKRVVADSSEQGARISPAEQNVVFGASDHASDVMWLLGYLANSINSFIDNPAMPSMISTFNSSIHQIASVDSSAIQNAKELLEKLTDSVFNLTMVKLMQYPDESILFAAQPNITAENFAFFISMIPDIQGWQYHMANITKVGKTKDDKHFRILQRVSEGYIFADTADVNQMPTYFIHFIKRICLNDRCYPK